MSLRKGTDFVDSSETFFSMKKPIEIPWQYYSTGTSFLLAFFICTAAWSQSVEYALFNGKDLNGWKIYGTEKWYAKDGELICESGPDKQYGYLATDKSFKDFELRVDVMTLPGANGGIFIDTEFLDTGWPAKGFEVQVNNTYVKDPRKTASLYEVKDNGEEVAKDNQWFTEYIIAKGDTLTIKVNDKLVTEWSRPADWAGTKTSRVGASAREPSRCKGMTRQHGLLQEHPHQAAEVMSKASSRKGRKDQ